MAGYLDSGNQVLVSAFADNPQDAIDHHVSLNAMVPPDPAMLADDEIIIAGSIGMECNWPNCWEPTS